MDHKSTEKSSAKKLSANSIAARSFRISLNTFSERLDRKVAFFVVRPAGRTYLEVKVLYSPDKGKS
jgi:hypothetical protein